MVDSLAVDSLVVDSPAADNPVVDNPVVDSPVAVVDRLAMDLVVDCPGVGNPGEGIRRVVGNS